jgi:hypothetical protein
MPTTHGLPVVISGDAVVCKINDGQHLAFERNPVPTGLANRRRGDRRGAPLLRTPRTLPRVLGLPRLRRCWAR